MTRDDANAFFLEGCSRLESNGLYVDHTAKTVTIPDGFRPGLKLLGLIDLGRKAGYTVATAPRRKRKR